MMKKLTLILTLLITALCSFQSLAQFTEEFNGTGCSSCSSFSFTQGGVQYDVSISGTSVYMDDAGFGDVEARSSSGNPITVSIARNDGNNFIASSILILNNFPGSGDITITGYSSGSVVGSPVSAPGVPSWTNYNIGDITVDELRLTSAGRDFVFDKFSGNNTAGPSCSMTASITSQTNVTCSGGNDGALTVTQSGGAANFNYTWSNGSNTNSSASSTNSITNLEANTYTVTVTDDNGCTATASATITEPSVIGGTGDDNTYNLNTANGGFICSSNTGIDNTFDCASDGSGPIDLGTFNDLSISGAIIDSIILTIYGACSGDVEFFINGVSLVSGTASGLSCSCQSISSDPNIPQTYVGVITSAVKSAYNIGGANTLSVETSNSNSGSQCFYGADVKVVSGGLSFSTQEATCDSANGSIGLSISGGTTPYSYLWSNGDTSENISGLLPGTYTVTITDANGCSATGSDTITQAPSLLVSAFVDSNASCNGSAGGLTASASGGTAPYFYSWNNNEQYTGNLTSGGTPSASSSVGIYGPEDAFDGNSTVWRSANQNNNWLKYDFGAGNEKTIRRYQVQNGAFSGPKDWVFQGSNDNNNWTDLDTVINQSWASGQTKTFFANNSTAYRYYRLGDLDFNNSPSSYFDIREFKMFEEVSTPSLSGVEADVYTVTVTDNNGCTSTASATITEPDSLLFSSTTLQNVSCPGGNDGEVQFIATGGTQPYVFSGGGPLIPFDGDTIFSGLTAIPGIALYAQDGNGCIDTAIVTITEPPALDPVAVVDSNVSCNGLSDGGVSVTTTGGTGGIYTYEWSTGSTDSSVTGLAAGTYTVTVTDGGTCTSTASATITEPATLVAAAVVDSNASCNGFTDGGATASATGGTPAYSYMWSNSATTASITGVAAGTYTATITDANGCTSTASATITEPVTLVAAAVVDSNVTCNGFSDGGATASATGGTTAYNYLWSNGATTASITGLVASTYTATITDANGCTSTASATITEPTALVAAAVVDSNASCNGFADGGVSVSASGGTAPYSYLWSTGSPNTSLSGLPAGTYTVTVTDDNGCNSTSSATVTEPPLVDASFAYANDEYCIDDSDPTPTITGMSGGIFSANSGLISLNSSTGEIDLSASDAGIYSISYTTAGACPNTEFDTVEVYGTLSAYAGLDQEVCGNSTFLAASSNLGYKGVGTWSILSGAGGSIADPNDPNSSFSGTYGTTYTLRWTVANGVCSDRRDEVSITFYDNPTAATAGPDQTGNSGVCGSLTTLSGNIAGGFSETGTWSEVSGDGNAVFTNVNNPTTTFSGTRGITYTLRWTIGNGVCPNSTDDVQVEFLLDPISNAGADQVVCGASTFLNGTATNGTGVWRITGGAGGFLNDSTAANTIFSGTKGELYTLQWVVSNGSCPVASDFVNVTFYDNTTNADAGTDQVGVTDGICGDTTVLTANAANKFGETGTWTEVSGDENGSFADVNNPNSGFSGTPGVSYTLSWFIDNGVCPSNADSVDIEFKEVVVASAAVSNQVSCFAAADGSIDLTVSGGTGNYIYSWSNSETTEDISGLDIGTYYVTVEDANGCSDTSMATITEPSEITGSTMITACDNYTVPSGDETYNTSGIYMDTIPALNGCDSIITIDLTVLYRSFSSINPVACDSYTTPSGNMTYTSSGGYLDTLTNSVGCDSIISINLTVNYTTTSTEVLTVCDRYTVPSGDETYNNSGIYMDTIPNSVGCDSIITFDLTVLYSTTGTETLTVCDNYTVPSGDETYNNSGIYMDTIPNSVGCDSIVTIDLTVNYSNSNITLDRVTACDSYTWTDGVTYTSSNNTARDTFPNAAGCDSVIVLDLTILNSTSSTDQVTACDSYSWIDGNLYTASNNTATFTFTNLAGCDSVITLDLTIINSSGSTDQITACDSYTWTNGMTYTSSNNTATDTFVNAAGCDSIVTLDLTINSSNGSTDQITACDSYTWIDGNTYTSSNNTATVLYTNGTGCDSVVNLDLTILDATFSADVIRACESYTWTNGVTYTQSNVTAKDTFVNAAGCDSIVSLSLTILNSSTGIDAVTACGSYTWIDGITYTSSNNSAKDTLVNFVGCDSIVSLNLIIENADTTVTMDGNELEAGASNATYQWVTCGANTPIAGETGRTFTPIVNGYYAVEVTQDGCTTLSRCYSVNTVGIDDPSFANDIKVYPNPTNGLVTIDLGNNTDKLNIIINDVVGRSVYAKTAVTGSRLDVNLFEAKAGIYFINIADQNGNNKVIKLIKY